MDPQDSGDSNSHIGEGKTGSDSYHVEDTPASSLSAEHADFIMQRHGALNLSPVPSMDPADPLNWPSWKKHTNLWLVAFHAMMTTFIAAGIIPAYEILAEILHVSIQEISYLTGVQILFLGVAPILWIPISNRFGRRPIWLLSTLASGLCCIGCAKSKTYGVMMVCRILHAIFISPPLAIGTGVVVETFFSHERGRKLGIWTLLVTLGPPGGPFIMGFVTEHLGWEWVYWLFAIINGAQFVGYLFFGPETRYVGPHDQNTSQFKAEYLQFRRIDPKPFSASDFYGPLKMFPNIDILVLAMSYALVFGFCSVAIIIELPQLFGPTFGLNAQQLGLQFIALVIGTVIGEQCGGPLSDLFMKRYIKKLNRRPPHPEHRLWLSYFGFICSIVGIIVFCVQMQKAVFMEWNVTPLIGVGIMGFGNQIVTTVLITFAVDCHPQQSASVGIIISLVRQVWGFICPFWVPQMFGNLGYGGSAGLMSGLIVAVSILPVLIVQWSRSRKILGD